MIITRVDLCVSLFCDINGEYYNVRKIHDVADLLPDPGSLNIPSLSNCLCFLVHLFFLVAV